MDKQTPTQIATQSMKGCGKVPIRYEHEERNGFHRNKEILCGEVEKDDLCFICKSKILAHKQDWENELEVLEGLRSLANVLSEDRDLIQEPLTNRISELTSALKILEIK